MSKKYGYGWEKLYSAVHSLVGSGDYHSRLLSAILSLHTLSLRPEEKHLPADVQIEFDKFYASMTAKPSVGNKGSIESTVYSLSKEEVSKAAETILNFYDTVCRYKEPV